MSNVLFIKYEDMKSDLRGIIRQVAVFVGKPLNGSQIEKLADHLSFENMKENPSVNKKTDSPWIKAVQFSDPDHIRSGKSESFKESMSPEMIGKFNKWMKEHNQEGLTYL